MAPDLRLRRGRPADAAVLGPIMYAAFRSIAESHNFPWDFPSPDAGVGLAERMLAHPRIYSVVAERDGRVVGSNFLDERDRMQGVGPITVEPAVQNQGVGRRLMEDVLGRGRETGASGIRLVQSAYHMRSLSLYTKLGFWPRETLACLQGSPPQAPLVGRKVRPARPEDLPACGALCTRVHGHNRNGELSDAIHAGSATVVETGGEITGYASAVAFFAHMVGETNADLQALIARANRIEGPGLLVPVRNAELFRWGLEGGLRIIQTMTLMTVGEFRDPSGPYIPSIFY